MNLVQRLLGISRTLKNPKSPLSNRFDNPQRTSNWRVIQSSLSLVTALVGCSTLKREETKRDISLDVPTVQMIDSLKPASNARPAIMSLEFQYFVDTNGNGKHDSGETFYSRKQEISEVLPEQAIVVAFVPEHLYWGKGVDVTLYDLDVHVRFPLGRLDLTSTTIANSYIGKPRGVVTFMPSAFKEEILRGSLNVLNQENFAKLLKFSGEKSENSSYTRNYSNFSQEKTSALVGETHRYLLECSAPLGVVQRGTFSVRYSSMEDSLKK